ncbi:DUF6221 family protein [Streptomyces sp. NPDC051642]|uniref:DUF6221 family protein n=1 Tax=Streptomyces sp. NPDC051642 TaxID=3154646 RepID=UPI003449BF96
MSSISEFLRARYAEMRTLAEEARDGNWNFQPYPPLAPGDDPVKYEAAIARARFIEALQPDHTLADLDAKLAILDEHPDVNDGDCGTCVTGRWGYPTHGGSSPQRYPCRTLRLAAVPFAKHPDYDQRWAL